MHLRATPLTMTSRPSERRPVGVGDPARPTGCRSFSNTNFRKESEPTARNYGYHLQEIGSDTHNAVSHLVARDAEDRTDHPTRTNPSTGSLHISDLDPTGDAGEGRGEDPIERARRAVEHLDAARAQQTQPRQVQAWHTQQLSTQHADAATRSLPASDGLGPREPGW